jgi:aminopeptidase-like protein
VRPEALAGSFRACMGVFDVLETNAAYVNLSPKGEPQLGRRGLYRAIGTGALPAGELALLWVLNLSDGRHTLLDIAERSGLPFAQLRAAAQLLEEDGLLRVAT